MLDCNQTFHPHYTCLKLHPTSCIVAIKCVEPAHVENASLSTTDVLVYSAVIEYECLLGYRIPSRATQTNSTCIADGTWTMVDPCQCELNLLYDNEHIHH